MQVSVDRSVCPHRGNVFLASDESQNTQISVISANGTKENAEIPTTHRTRTYTESSVSSMKSIKSFYSVNSATSKEGDFYSVCSEESYKST
jgi:hypothetical protein